MNSKPIVVFTDGFSFHRERLGLDCAQRTALLLSGNFLVWSLDWDDVNTVFAKNANVQYTDMVEVVWDEISDKYWNLANLTGSARIIAAENSFSLLISYLSNPKASEWQTVAKAYAIIAGLRKRPQVDLTSSLPDPLQRFAKLPSASLTNMVQVANLKQYISLIRRSKSATDFQVSLLFNFDDSEKAKAHLDFQAHWAGFLRAMNVFQFVDSFAAITSESLLANNFEAYSPLAQQILPAQESSDERQKLWDEVAELTSDIVSELVQALRKTDLEVPEVGYELAKNRSVLGEIELAWLEAKVGIVTEDYQDLITLLQGDWQLFLATDPNVLTLIQEALAAK